MTGRIESPESTPTAARDGWTYAGILAVAVAAAVLSFDSLTGLAQLAGVTGRLAGFRLSWLLPVSVDAYAVTATRVWLRTAGTAHTAAYARRNAVGAIVLSVAGNATFHGLTAAGVTTLGTTGWSWLLVVAVSAVAPVMLGLVAHLHALVSADHRAPVPAANGKTPTRQAVPVPETANAAPDSETPPSRSRSTRSRPAPHSRSRARDAGAEAVMREHWAREHAAGRTPSGAELDRVAGTRDYGRKVRRALLAEAANETATAATTTNDPDTSEPATTAAPHGPLSVVAAEGVSA